MTMTPAAAVERRFNDPDAIQLKYQLAWKDLPRPGSVSGVLHPCDPGQRDAGDHSAAAAVPKVADAAVAVAV